MKLSKIGLIGAFVPALALAADPPPVDTSDTTGSQDQTTGSADQTMGSKDQLGSKDQTNDASGRPFGVVVKPLTADRRESYGGPKEAGLLVTQIDSSGVAAQAGIKVGDVITKIDDTLITNSDDLATAWAQSQKADKSEAEIQVVRDHKTMDVEAKLEQNQQDKTQDKLDQPKIPDDNPDNG